MAYFLRYEFGLGWKKKYGWFPIPHPHWQRSEYIDTMGREPPVLPDCWQFSYNPRSKKSREKLKEFLDDHS